MRPTASRHDGRDPLGPLRDGNQRTWRAGAGTEQADQQIGNPALLRKPGTLNVTELQRQRLSQGASLG